MPGRNWLVHMPVLLADESSPSRRLLLAPKKGSRSITDYLAEMYALFEALALSQNPISEEDLVINILNGLGSDYSDLLSAIRVRKEALPLTEHQDILLERETKIHEAEAESQSILPTANATHLAPPTGVRRNSQQFDSRRGSMHRRGRGTYPGHNSRSSNSQVVCRFCDIPGHEVRQCRKLQRFLRENHLSHMVSSPPPAVNTTAMNTSTSQQPWLFDSGASHHVASDASLLPSFNEYGGPDEVRLGDGSGHGGVAHARGEP
ncbi:unnamed protein product [Cuscuta epithymum]|uniref:Uncharacterized protein n=1 Tax=Cuscuta epithymum TaxID=186058 RepID=A0AAV0DAQ9_9ASTE|nr:unnamed protein product [Cuscuta epithymum]CAH9138113.1 unnamed protein product [Cuscuta epithymum]